MQMKHLCIASILFTTTSLSAAGLEFQQAVQPRAWAFPRDHGRHDGFKTEWWYFTGNLRDAAGRRFGYQLTFFRSAFAPSPATRPSAWGLKNLYFAHAAISDVDGRAFVFKDRMERGRTGLAEASEQTLDVSLLDWSAAMKPDGIHLHATEKEFSLDLTCARGRGPVLQGPGGVNAKARGPGHASYYYSLTRLPTAGTLTVGGHTYHVEGSSWMDHEFSSDALSGEQVGWDWMGLHLSNGSDLMIYRIRGKSAADDYLSGTLIAPDGTPRYLASGDIRLDGSDPWKSPATGGVYPQRWRVSCAGLPELIVKSAMPGQELITKDSTKVNYFEGAADVIDSSGKPAGEGYLEMTGYSREG